MLNVYRQLLRLYPAAYRREFADEMLAVFEEARCETVRETFIKRGLFNLREVAGLVGGACKEHLRIAEWKDLKVLLPRKEFIMRNGFRFPKSTVVFMMLILGGVLVACCDTIGRIVLAPAELPAGAVMALVGGSSLPYLTGVLGDRQGLRVSLLVVPMGLLAQGGLFLLLRRRMATVAADLSRT